jgi:hypothetical protein
LFNGHPIGGDVFSFVGKRLHESDDAVDVFAGGSSDSYSLTILRPVHAKDLTLLSLRTSCQSFD